MRGKIHHLAGAAKGVKHPREQSVRISRFNNSNQSTDNDNLVNSSLHDFERAKNKD